MPRYSILDSDDKLLAVVDAESADLALAEARKKFPLAMSAEEKAENVPHGAL